MHNAENVVALLNKHDELTLDHLVETRKQNAPKQAEEPEPKERTMRVLKLAESRWITDAGIRMFEDTDSNEQGAARTRQRIIRERACYEEIVTEKRRYLSCQTSVLDFFKTISETCASPPYCWTMQMMIQMIQEEGSPPQIVIYLSVLTLFVNPF
jgi:hypothetical protein